MANKIRSAIGGLAMLASTAFGQSVTNAPVITGIGKEIVDPTRDKITVTARNFNNGVSFGLYKSTNMVDWIKVKGVTYSGVDPIASVSRPYLENNSDYRRNAFYRLKSE